MSEQQTSNAIDPTTAKRFVGEIEACLGELESLRGSYMKACKGVRDRIGEWKERAEAAGVPRRPLNHLLKRRDLAAKSAKHESEAEEEVVETADMIDQALGGEKGLAGTGLGASAGGSGEDNEDLRGTRQKEREAARKTDAAENLAGMKTPEDLAKRATARKAKRSAALDDLANGPTH